MERRAASPLLRLRRPTDEAVRAWLVAQPDAPLPYPAVGGTRQEGPGAVRPAGLAADWNLDHRHIHLGQGEALYHAARAALWRFAPLDIGWVQPVTTAEKPLPDGLGAMLVHAYGLWWVNAWQIVYVDDDRSFPDGRRVSAFAYGTLAAHAERGEERFMVELLPDGSVWYDVLAFSRPHHWLARLGGPVTRRLQLRFGPESAERMRRAVAGTQGGTA